jgi:predicted component of type VI protein secretion system
MILGPAVGASFPLLDKRLVIGRGEDCDLPVNDTSVSRIHAEIHVIEGGRYEVIDRDSSNGVRVNGVELKRTILDAGDVIELGDVQLRFVLAGQPYHPQEPPAGASRRRSVEPGTDHGDHARSPTRAVAIVAAVVACLVLGAIVLMRNDDITVSASPSEISPATKALKEASALLARGDLEGALKKSQEIPEESNLRESTAFKEIQAKWADGVLKQAAKETDRTKKRALLDQIAKSPDVGSMLRKRAANDIAALDADSVGIEQLPSAEKHTKPPDVPTPTVAPPPAPPQNTPPPAPVPKRKPEAKSEPRGGLVRDTPF